ncbi:MAG TPA: hypothetical protein EYF95_03505 [Flavobacteriales bacterium]|jgi:hypothetical protein|nr:hypothetical protein [Flavobacteriales bacterium]
MNYSNQKYTKRFTYGISRNSTSHQAGANSITISTNPAEGQQYSTGTVGLTMSVREAKALQSFLNTELEFPLADADVDSDSTSV